MEHPVMEPEQDGRSDGSARKRRRLYLPSNNWLEIHSSVDAHRIVGRITHLAPCLERALQDELRDHRASCELDSHSYLLSLWPQHLVNKLEQAYTGVCYCFCLYVFAGVTRSSRPFFRRTCGCRRDAREKRESSRPVSMSVFCCIVNGSSRAGFPRGS